MKTHILPLIIAVGCMASCKDYDVRESSFIHGSDEVFMEAKDLYGSWDVDLDNNSKYNIARMRYTYSAKDVVMDYEIYDVYGDTLLETTKSSDWEIAKDYQGFSEQGVRGDAIRIKIGDDHRYWMIKDVWKDSIKCFTYMPDVDEPIEISLYRAGSKEDVAPIMNVEGIRRDPNVVDLVSSLMAEKEEIPNIDFANWMYERVKRDVKLCHISIPGTHDSGTSGIGLFTSFAAKTQEKTLAEQWDAGVRSFDLRVRNKPSESPDPNALGVPYIFHNFIPCNLSYEEAITSLLRKAAQSKECAFVFINTESNKELGDKHWVDVIKGLLLLENVELDYTPLDEKGTREQIYKVSLDAEAKVKKEFGLKDDIIIGYRPDLTMKEAEGKLIVVNRMSDSQQKDHFPFVGSAVLGTFSGAKDIIELKNRGVGGSPSDTVVYSKCIKVNDLYTNNEDEDATQFNERKVLEMEQFMAEGNEQRTKNLKQERADILYFNSASASIGDLAGTAYTPIPDYPSVAEDVYPRIAGELGNLRTCGIMPMDYAGTHKFGRLSLNEVIAIIAVTGPDPIALAVIAAADAAKSKKVVDGDGLLDALINQSAPVKLDSVRLQPNIITGAKPKDEYQLKPLFYPADADDHVVKSWSSSRNDVATVGNNGLVQVRKIGNSQISVQTEGGARHAIYVVAPDPRSKMEAVDLGLSVLWADRNIGAANPEWDGYFYTWGDIKEQLHDYVPSEYLYGSSFEKYFKYGPNSLPYLLSLDAADDAAHHLGNGWRMPTKQEVDELMSISSGVKWEADELNGIKGYFVSGMGNTIFLPAAGYMVGYDIHHDQPYEGFFWTRDLFQTAQVKWEDACCLYIRNSGNPFYGIANNHRYFGMPIRPVKDKK